MGYLQPVMSPDQSSTLAHLVAQICPFYDDINQMWRNFKTDRTSVIGGYPIAISIVVGPNAWLYSSYYAAVIHAYQIERKTGYACGIFDPEEALDIFSRIHTSEELYEEVIAYQEAQRAIRAALSQS